jgi:methyltransferase (TIGR00027 family)
VPETEIPAGVGWTALLTAYGRAQESGQEHPQFDDPLAVLFIEAVTRRAGNGEGLPRLGPASDDHPSMLWKTFRFYFAQRTPLYDQRVLEAVDAGCSQVVLLGAGLDSRAFRLGLGSKVRVFELDQAPVLNFKHDVLARHGLRPDAVRIPVAVDLLADWSSDLTSAGFDPRQPTLWVAEGLLMYLSRADADLLLDRVTALSAPGSRITTENFDRHAVDADMADDGTMDEQDWAAWHMVSGAFRYGPADEAPAAWLADHGWTPGETISLADLGRQHGQAIPPGFDGPGALRILLYDGIYTH